MSQHYLVECRPDEVLVRTLLSARKKELQHCPNKAEVVKAVARTEGCIGFVDKDPGSPWPTVFGESFEQLPLPSGLAHPEEPLGLWWFSCTRSRSHLVVLDPRLEEWVIQAAHMGGVDVNDFGLPTDPRALHRRVNARLDKWEDLLGALAEGSRMRALKAVVLAAM